MVNTEKEVVRDGPWSEQPSGNAAGRNATRQTEEWQTTTMDWSRAIRLVVVLRQDATCANKARGVRDRKIRGDLELARDPWNEAVRSTEHRVVLAGTAWEIARLDSPHLHEPRPEVDDLSTGCCCCCTVLCMEQEWQEMQCRCPMEGPGQTG